MLRDAGRVRALRPNSSIALWAWVIGVGALAALAVEGLPSNAFYTGDSGVKLIATRNAIAHPDRPTEIDLPTIGGQPRPDVEQFFAVHGTHAHAVQSVLFPILSAPFVALFGLHGALVLPIVAFISLFPALNVVRRSRLDSVSPWFLAIVILTSPLVFYALEFWEHLPAVALLTICMAMATPTRDVPVGRVAAVGAGIAAGVAILLRPEAVWFVVALGVLWMPRNVFLRLAGGVAAVLALFAAWNVVHGNSVMGTHVTANLTAPVYENWLSAMAERALLWLVPQQAIVLVAALLLGVAYALSARRSQWTLVIGACAVLLVGLAAVSRELSRAQILSAWPLGALALLPTAASPAVLQLRSITALTVVAILFTATNDGGAQWGPRYLLVAMPSWLLLVAASLGNLTTGEGVVRRINVGVIALLLCCSLMVTRHAYRDLRGTKRIYSELVARIDAGRRGSRYVLTDVWWVDQVAASLYGDVTFLYARDQGAARLTLRALQDAGVDEVTVVAAAAPTGLNSMMDAAATTCYAGRDVTVLQPHDLTLTLLTCHPTTPGAITR